MRNVYGWWLSLVFVIGAGWLLVTYHNPLVRLVAGVLWIGCFGLFGTLMRRPWMAGILATAIGFVILWGFSRSVGITEWLLPLTTGAIVSVTTHLSPHQRSTEPSWVNGIWAVILFFLASIAVSTTEVHVSGHLGSHLLVLVGVYLLTPVIEIGIIFVLMRGTRQHPGFFTSNYPKITGTHVWLGLLTGFGASLLMSLVVAAESHIGHVRVQSNNPFVYATGLNVHAIVAMVLVAAAVVLVAPVTEEILFRGIVFGSFIRRWPYPVASVGSAFLFGLAHMDLTLLLPLTIAGILLNALYHKTRSLVPSTIAHATLNAVSIFLAIFAAR